ncbi:MAG TPA: gliding motility-associated C-terminal domain-containing protein [Bacteroidia bacterium]|jgi:gliding motility-associated-like protein
MKKNNIEDLFKESFENFEAEASPSVWKNIQSALKGAGLGLFAKMLLNKIGTNTIVAVISSAAAVIGTVLVMDASKTETAPKKEAAPKVIAESQKPSVEEIKSFLTEDNQQHTVANKADSEIEKPETNNSTTLTIRKEKINSVIKEYSEQSIADISASPIAGTVPLIVNLTNNGTGKINKWNFGDGKKENGVNPVHYYDIPGIYTIALTSTNAEGKTSTDSVKIEVTGNSSIRSASGDFSPNQDGDKDYFGFNAENLISQNVVVFDKNSTIVYKSESLSARWDGTNLKGKPAKDGVYFYIQKAEGKDGKKYEQSGKITLKR